MHSRVFQIESKPIDGEKIEMMSESQFDIQYFPHYTDYFCDSDDREDDIDWLVGELPKGMFQINSDKTILTYVEYPTEYIKKYCEKLQELASKITPETIGDSYQRWQLKVTADYNNNDFLVYNESYGYPEHLFEWLIEVATKHAIGDKFYLGSTIDYHF